MNLSKLTKNELMNLAKEKQIKNRTKMNKAELVAQLEPFFQASTNAESSTNNVGYDTAPKPEKNVKPKRDEYPIPAYYNKDMIALMPVDPTSEYVYWEISDHTMSEAKQRLNIANDEQLTLKVFAHEPEKVLEFASVKVERIGCWYFNINLADKIVWAELGYVDKDGVYHSLIKSKTIKMPADKVSEIVDEETWMTIGGDLDKLYKLSGVGMRDANSSISIHEEVIKQLQIHAGSSNMSFKAGE